MSELLDKHSVITELLNLQSSVNALIERILEQNAHDTTPISAGVWIPCTEHLPNEFCKVVGLYKNGDVEVVYYNPIQTTRFPKGFSKIEGSISWRQDNIVAWLPLPSTKMDAERKDNETN